MTAPGGPPLNIVATPETPVSVQFRWDPPSAPNGRIMYLVECTSEDDGVTSPVINTTMELVTPLNGLTPAAAYSCVFTAHTDVGPGPSAPIEIVTCKLYIVSPNLMFPYNQRLLLTYTVKNG